MGKIPIGRTIGEAFDFALGRYLAILGVIWLPLLLLLVAEYFVLIPYFARLFEFIQFVFRHAKDHAASPAEFEAARPFVEFQAMRGYVWLVEILAVVVSVWIQVGIVKTVLGLRTGPLYVYVSVGLDELRVIAGYLAFFAILYGSFIAIAIVCGIGAVVIAALVSGGAMDISTIGLPWIFGGIGVLVAALLAAVIYIQVRLLFFLVPVTVAEKRFGLWHSWTLSRGNFWRIFVVDVGTLSPLLAFEFVLVLAFYIFVLFAVLANVAALRANGQAAHGPAAALAVVTMLLKYLAVYGGVMAAIVLPLLPIIYGLRDSPGAFAYKSLEEKAS